MGRFPRKCKLRGPSRYPPGTLRVPCTFRRGLIWKIRQKSGKIWAKSSEICQIWLKLKAQGLLFYSSFVIFLLWEFLMELMMELVMLVLLVHGFLVLRESRRSLSVEPVQVVTLCAKVTCRGMNGVEIMTRVPRRHGDRHGE